MRWPDVRNAHRDQWLVVEVLSAHADGPSCVIDHVAVVEVCADGRATMQRCRELRREHPQRDLCFVHTSVADLRMDERLWLANRGVRVAGISP